MSGKRGVNNAVVSPPASHGTEHMFDSLQKARLKAKQLRQATKSPADAPLQGGEPQNDE